MTDGGTKARPWVVKLAIPVEETGYLYIGAKTKEEAEEAATDILASTSQYENAAIVEITEYQRPATPSIN